MQGDNRGTRAGLSDRRVPMMSHASRIQSPEKGKAPETSAIFGLNVQECFASYDRESHSLRTFQGSLFPTEGNSSTEFCRTFSRAGMMRNGRLYQLKTSERRTLEKGYLLWVSPKAWDCIAVTMKPEHLVKHRKKQIAKQCGCGMVEQFAWVTGSIPNLNMQEWVMGFPKNWMRLEAVVTPLSLNVPR